MSTEIEAVVNASEIESKNIEVGEWGLTFKAEITPAEWYETALAIQKFDGKLQWYLGDLAVYAESPVTGWGESKYADLVAATGYDYNTMKRFAVVARRFPTLFRETLLEQGARARPITLSWSHFSTVTALDDNFAAYWLQKAADNAWGRDKLREEIRKWREERGEIAEKEEEPIGHTSFKEFEKEFFKGFSPRFTHETYDKKSWLLEVRDVIDDELESLGVVNV